MKRSMLAAACVIFLAAEAFAQGGQTAYSESRGYRPRDDPRAKGGKKKKDEQPEKKGGPTAVGPPALRVLVLDDAGTRVAGLKAADFKLFVDGQEAKIDSVEVRGEPVNFIFLVDASPSAHELRDDIVGVATQILKKLGPGDRAMVIDFAQGSNVLCELTDDLRLVETALRKLEKRDMRSGTSVYDLVRSLSEKYLPKMAGPTAIVFFTDGVDTTSGRANFVSSLAAAERMDAQVYMLYLDTLNVALEATRPRTLSTGSAVTAVPPLSGLPTVTVTPRGTPDEVRRDYQIGVDWVNDLVVLSGGRSARLANAAVDLTGAIGDPPADMRAQYVVRFTPRVPGTPGQSRELKLRVARPGLTVMTRGSYVEP